MPTAEFQQDDMTELMDGLLARLRGLVTRFGAARGVRVWSCERPHYEGATCMCGAPDDLAPPTDPVLRAREMAIISAVCEAAAEALPLRADQAELVAPRVAQRLARILAPPATEPR